MVPIIRLLLALLIAPLSAHTVPHIKHIAEYLKEAGYATAMIAKNDFGHSLIIHS